MNFPINQRAGSRRPLRNPRKPCLDPPEPQFRRFRPPKYEKNVISHFFHFFSPKKWLKFIGFWHPPATLKKHVFFTFFHFFSLFFTFFHFFFIFCLLCVSRIFLITLTPFLMLFFTFFHFFSLFFTFFHIFTFFTFSTKKVTEIYGISIPQKNTFFSLFFTFFHFFSLFLHILPALRFPNISDHFDPILSTFFHFFSLFLHFFCTPLRNPKVRENIEKFDPKKVQKNVKKTWKKHENCGFSRKRTFFTFLAPKSEGKYWEIRVPNSRQKSVKFRHFTQ